MLFLDRVMISPLLVCCLPFELTTGYDGGAGSCRDDCKVLGED